LGLKDTFLVEDALTLARNVAMEAGALLMRGLGSVKSIEYKGAVDIVTEMDRASEELIVSTILRHFPDHGVLTEERAEMRSGSAVRWIIDPLDGTTNFAHGFPVFCVSIAVEVDGAVVAGVVYDPTRDELFHAGRGEGAFLNGARIAVSGVSSLDRALLATGFPYDIRVSALNNLDHFADFAVRAQAIRRAGAAALDMCYVAAGRFDGFWELKLKPWDVAAAKLVVVEAGGVATDFSGAASTIHDAQIAASNSLIHDAMLDVLSIRQK
jgi:myo-inositol-1(or 4)-monophosphatase